MKIKTNKKNNLNIIKKTTKVRKAGSNYIISIPAIFTELYNINSNNKVIWKYNPNTNELTIELK